MAITKLQADTATVYHLEPTPWGTGRPCTHPNGPMRWRRNGATRRWKREPSRFEIPVKHGLRSYDRIDNAVAEYVHTAEDCTVSPF